MNKWDIIITVFLICILAAAVWKIIRNKKEGKYSCGCCKECCGCGNKKK